MIQYALKCCEGHQFDSWFQSASAFDKLQSAGLVTCATCGTTQVSKVLMAPAVRPTRATAKKDEAFQGNQTSGPLSTPASPEEQKIAELRRSIEANSEYVGGEFAKKARAMHDGDAPETSIYGEANLEEAKKLVEDGVPVLPLPFRPSGKDN
jgi:hypothetical protein